MTTPQIARAFLVNERTLAQRIVRAKRKIVSAGIALTVPADDVLAERLADVLAVIALMYNEGFVSSDGGTQDRDLAGDAVWLAGVVATSLPRRGRGVGAGRAADVPARPRRRPLLRRGRPGAAARPGPVAVGPRRDRRRRGHARAGGGAALPRPVPAPGRDRGLPRDQPVVGRDRLAPDRHALRGADQVRPVARRPPQPCRRDVAARTRRRSSPRWPRSTSSPTGSTATTSSTPPAPSC